MRLPNAEKAIVDVRKLRHYALNPDHSVGKHKARVFASSLGLTAEDAEELREAILAAVLQGHAEEASSDSFGRRYIIDFRMVRQNREAVIRSCWIVLNGEDAPRFVTCFVL